MVPRCSLRDAASDQCVCGRQDATDEQADRESLGDEDPVVTDKDLRCSGQCGAEQADQQDLSIADYVAAFAEKRDEIKSARPVTEKAIPASVAISGGDPISSWTKA